MTVIFFFEEVTYTTDPEVVPGSRQLEEGDYVRLPDGRLLHFKSDNPVKLVEVSSEKVPAGQEILNAIIHEIK